MNVTKKWHTLAVPETLFSRIKKVIRYTGHTSVSEYVRFACLERLPNDEATVDDAVIDEQVVRSQFKDRRVPKGDSL